MELKNLYRTFMKKRTENMMLNKIELMKNKNNDKKRQIILENNRQGHKNRQELKQKDKRKKIDNDKPKNNDSVKKRPNGKKMPEFNMMLI